MSIKPRYSSNFKVEVEAIVMPKLNKSLPNQPFEMPSTNLNTYLLAVPNFNISSRIDIIIGADMFPKIIEANCKKICGVLLQKTTFGWNIFGNIKRTTSSKVLAATTTTEIADIERFWELEAEEEAAKPENIECEEFFKSTVQRDTDGKFIVSIPLK